jgi:4-amino-4-deoxy-L-arabinose transferase-like glycosyltransferase
MTEPHRGVTPWFILLLAAYVVLGVGFAVRTPAWQAPDEPAHYNYIAQVAANGCCPTLEVGDWDQSYINQLTSAHFAPSLLANLGKLQYEDHQPPLYYLIATPIFALSNGSLIALRLLSVVIGAGVVLCAYGVGLTMLPTRPFAALGAAAFVAFLPQHLAGLASVQNDGLAELIVGLTLLATILYVKGGAARPWHLGLLVGLGLLTKVSTLFLAGLVPLALLLRAYQPGERYRLPLRALIEFALPALLLGTVWWARDISVYGFPDIFGLGRHNHVVADQPRTATLIAQAGWNEYLRHAVTDSFHSFWGQFGWMALPLPEWSYTLILVLIGVVIIGLVIDRFVRLADEGASSPGQRDAWILLFLTLILGVAQFVYYNTEFLQFQGRYMFPALIPLGLWMAIGVDGWRRLLPGWRFTVWLPVVAIGLLGLLDVYLLWRVIPLLAP